MERITEKMLNYRVEHLNNITGHENDKYNEIDSYTLSFAYGGVSLHRIVNDCGGVVDVFSCGHVPKRELFGLIKAYISGIQLTDKE